MNRFFQLCTELLALADNIPATFWGVVVGSVFTLIGVYFTNRSSDRRFQMQLEHDRSLKAREREMALRKDVYGAVAEAISVAINTLARFGDLSIPSDQLTASYIEKAPAFSSAHLVAKEKTVKALTDLSTELGGAFLRLSAERLPLLALQERITQKSTEINGFASVRDAMLELMRQQNIDGNRDERKFHVIRHNFDFEAERIAKAITEQDRLSDELRSQHLPLIKTCCSEAVRIGALVPPALIAVREELELSLNIDAYGEIVRQAQQKTEAQLEEFFQRISPPTSAV